MPTLARITIFPIKSLDGQSADRARVLPSGAIEHDRRFAIVDGEGNYVNGKRNDAVHALRSAVDLRNLQLELVQHHELATFSLNEDREEVEQTLSLYFHQRVRLIENALQGFPDDTDAPGPTIVSTATLETVASWFPGLSIDEVRRRFRANLEIGGVEPFWEDRLYGAAGEGVTFRIGGVTFTGVNPCQRCVVPSRDAQTGEVWPGFSKAFSGAREKSLPPWANRVRFDHYYRLAVNTSLAVGQLGGEVARGEAVKIG